ncbi:hypothetical protein AAFF_G00419400 [Aldrovandia affinis]|uniref:Uncharacterized protein n=1 Tax=Aldrovandia affinis TaxID=143900 RepID=A0AAD7WJ58_9TELE|nr:hypothetical protein AAFF_G00419400 [Aldrovandia affinis]
MWFTDVHSEEFRIALIRRESEHLRILLCYESYFACVGVKLHTDQNKTSLTDNDIETLLQENRADVRIALPVHTNIKIPVLYSQAYRGQEGNIDNSVKVDAAQNCG